MSAAQLEERARVANSFFLNQGIGFTVYGDEAGTERIFPFDLVPRIVPRDEWEAIERGLVQRLRALNLFLARHLPRPGHPRRRGRAGRSRLRLAALPARDDRRATCPGDIYAHVGGVDLVRDADGRYLVLEDNLRTPVGRQLHAREPRGA